VYQNQNFEECKQCSISSICRPVVTSLIIKFPSKKKGIANILVGRPPALCYYIMHNQSNPIDKYHYFFL
jgi:hypothetical protein